MPSFNAISHVMSDEVQLNIFLRDLAEAKLEILGLSSYSCVLQNVKTGENTGSSSP